MSTGAVIAFDRWVRRAVSVERSPLALLVMAGPGLLAVGMTLGAGFGAIGFLGGLTAAAPLALAIVVGRHQRRAGVLAGAGGWWAWSGSTSG